MNKLFTLFALLIFVGCAAEKNNSRYLRWVGDSTFDPEMDRKDFQLCYSENLVKQYFHFSQGLQYKGEKKELVSRIMEQYKPVESDQSGWVRIRFIVNCKGETGRFRLIESDEHYKERAFDEAISNQLLAITKSLDGWSVLPDEEKPRDYYQYLVFKIHKGNIVEILP